ncbi:hypothetical protein BDZ97DRAFT_467413 [Flammula alnicola]|nr:hypothetical protein BDZ97DRAFT_467413 [Flammula alnicola]
MTNNNSTPSLVLSPPPSNTDPPSVTSNNRQTTMSVASKKDKALAFLKFSKRSPRSPPPGTSSSAPSTSSSGSVIVISNSISASSNGSDEGDLPPPPQEDEGISLPWNFQHNIHVDEGYVGIPPSWSTSLASAGFTEEEIAAIQARRAAGVRSPPDLRYLYNERPRSPALAGFPGSNTNGTTAGVPVLTHPTPRTTSLHRIGPSAPSNLNPNNASSEPASSPFPSAATSTRPALPSINTSSSSTNSTTHATSNTNASTSTSNAAASSSSSTPLTTTTTGRKPPPKRKPPSSPLDADLEDELEAPRRKEVEGQRQGQGQEHRANQASLSTVGYSEEYSGYDASE